MNCRIFGAFIFLSLVALNASECVLYKQPMTLFNLDEKQLPEASGLECSKQNVLYHINDSGSGPYLYTTSLHSEKTTMITIKGMVPIDTEDLSLGICPSLKSASSCIYIADIGDNKKIRKTLTITYFDESEIINNEVKTAKQIQFKYPDGAHDAEGFSVHPNGDLYIFSKELDAVNRRAMPSKIYRLKNKTFKDAPKGKIHTLEFLGILDIPYILFESNMWGQLITSADISADGKRVLLLTYSTAVELFLDLSTDPIPSLRDKASTKRFRIIKNMDKLDQQEAVCYGSNDVDILYNTEFKESKAPQKMIPCEPTKKENSTNGKMNR